MSHDPAFAINHELRSHGFASLAEAGALIPQLAFCVRDHAHLRALINACDLEDRYAMYEALAPNLRFKAKPLADYLIELAQDAERRQLPTIGQDGQFRAFRTPELFSEPNSDAAVATSAAAEAIAKEHLYVVCHLCTREAVFDGLTKQDAVDGLRMAGWRWALKVPGHLKNAAQDGESERVEICPACVKLRAPRRRAA